MNFTILNLTNQTILRLSYLNEIDNTVRCAFLISHTFYFLTVIALKELKNLSYIHMHHVNLIGLLTSIHYCIWINKNSPLFFNLDINYYWCSLSEASWAILKYARTYSILSLAFYRYLTVFKEIKSYKLIYSIKFSLLTVFSVWFISVIIYLVAKFITKSMFGLILCYDGYSVYNYESIVYFILTALFGYVLPILIEFYLYLMIYFKLRDLFLILNNLNEQNKNIKESSKEMNKKHRMLFTQTVLINCLELTSVLFLILINVCNWIMELNLDLYFLRQLCRTINNLIQSIVPLVSIVYNPFYLAKLKNIKICHKNKIKTNKIIMQQQHVRTIKTISQPNTIVL